MKPELTPYGVSWSLDSNVEAWVAKLPIQAAAALTEFLAESPELWRKNSITVPAAFVAAWSASVAEQLGLPTNCPLAFDVRLSGAMGKPGAQIDRSLQVNHQLAQTS